MKKLTVASYNIRHGADAKFDMSLLASAVNKAGAEIVGIQEMDMCADRSEGRNQLEELKEALGFEYGYFLRCIDIKGGEYGTAIVSKYPITGVKTYKLFKGERCEQRMLGVYTLDIGARSLTFANTHLDYISESVIATQADEINEALRDEEEFFLTGDFNTGNFSLLRRIEMASIIMNEETRLVTFPSSGITIDNIIYRGKMKPSAYGTVDESYSDHYMLWATFEI